MNSERTFDVCVVGAGLIGLSVAFALSQAYRGIAIAVVDKEDRVAGHQSSHNSGVVHSGLYYKPGSLKARLCVEGRRTIFDMCQEHNVASRQCGKLVIATRAREIAALDELERRGRANGLVGLERLGPAGIRDHEPHAAGIEALYVPEAGIADFPGLAESIAQLLALHGSEIRLGHAVSSIVHGPSHVAVLVGDARLRAKVLVNCAGLHSDRVAALAGVTSAIRVIPFRGEYYRLSAAAAPNVKALIYPVPDPKLPFLGVHFTRRIDGSVEVGPNAVLAMAREQYRGVGPNWKDIRDVLTSKGFRKMAVRYSIPGGLELVRSRSTRLYASQARRLVPATTHEQLIEGGVGVRAQAIGSDGALIDDFVIERAGSTLHVLNAPSPGATASLAIGRYIAEKAEPLFRG